MVGVFCSVYKNGDLDCKFVRYDLYEGSRKIKERKPKSDEEE